MKLLFLFITLIFLPQYLFSQSMNVNKADGTTVEFKISEIDSISFTAEGSAIPVTTTAWECLTNLPSAAKATASKGVYEQSDDGLKIYGAGIQSNIVLHCLSESAGNISNKIISLKWKALSSGEAASANIDLYKDALTWSSPLRVLSMPADDVWYYTRILVSDGSASVITSTGNYDNLEGKIVQTGSFPITSDITTFTFGYTGSGNSYAILSEAAVK